MVYPQLVVTNQLQVERRTGKVRQSETDVLPLKPLCYATNPPLLARYHAKISSIRPVIYAHNFYKWHSFLF